MSFLDKFAQMNDTADVETNTNAAEEVVMTPVSHKIDVYTLSGCGWCKKTKTTLDSLGVEYTEHQLDDKIIFDKTKTMLIGSGTHENYQNVLEIFSRLNGDNVLSENVNRIIEGGSVEDSDQLETATTIADYLNSHDELIPVLEYFLRAEEAHKEVLDSFSAVVEKYETGQFVPQIIVDGAYFGGYKELSACIEENGNNFDACLLPKLIVETDLSIVA